MLIHPPLPFKSGLALAVQHQSFERIKMAMHIVSDTNFQSYNRRYPMAGVLISHCGGFILTEPEYGYGDANDGINNVVGD